MKQLETEVILIVPKNTSTNEIADLFSDAEIVSDPLIFKIFSYLHLKRGKYIQPGEYLFEKDTNLARIFNQILRGERYVRHVTFPEGFQFSNSEFIKAELWFGR